MVEPSGENPRAAQPVQSSSGSAPAGEITKAQTPSLQARPMITVEPSGEMAFVPLSGPPALSSSNRSVPFWRSRIRTVFGFPGADVVYTIQRPSRETDGEWQFSSSGIGKGSAEPVLSPLPVVGIQYMLPPRTRVL